jgi:hypothetical protein
VAGKPQRRAQEVLPTLMEDVKHFVKCWIQIL